jgi:RHS repeat-associated protein
VGSTHYLYDNQGNRVLTNASNASSTTDTIYFDGYTDTVISGGTSTTTTYYSANGTRIALRIGGSTLDYLVNDPLGSNSVALNNTGQVIAVQLYEPYGTMNYTWGAMPTAHNYTGQRLDSQSGLLYYNFRWYDPLTGQFARTDTKQNNAQGRDPYAYVSDNPETKNDPTGHWGWGDIIAATVVAVAVAVVVVVAAPVVIAAATATAGALAAGAFAVAAVSATEAVATTLTALTIASAGATALQSLNGASGGGGSCSFTANTPVSTQKGEQAIGTLHVGERVLAYNAQTHRMEWQPILHVWVHADNDLIDVTLTPLVAPKGGKTHPQTDHLHTTSEHPFLTKEKGFLPAGQLKAGMHVLRADGSFGLVTNWKRVPGTAVMYNLTVQQDHTFVVGLDQWVVHNTCLSPQQQSILQRLRTEVHDNRGNAKLAVLKSNGRPTNSISELYDSNGKMIARGISDANKDDPEGLFGDVQCSEGNCLINGWPLVRGQTYDLYTAQNDGLPACPACRQDLQQAADEYGITVNVYSIGTDGSMPDPVAYSPVTPEPTEPDLNAEEENLWRLTEGL